MRAAGAIAAGFLLIVPMIGAAQQSADATSLQQILEAQFPPATTTPDGQDLASAGTVVVLQKDNLVAGMTGKLPIPTPNSYANGSITQSGVLGWLAKGVANGPNQNSINRAFKSGDKFWVTKIKSGKDYVSFTLMSDPVDAARFHASLKFPFDKGSSPTPEQVLAEISEVLRNDAPPQPAAQTAAPSPGQSAASAAAQTKNIAPGQSKAQVEAMFGAPPKTFKNGTKEIYFYPDMKVTFVNNKVTDIE
jgi:hypothetical protein